jgi:hypothetical protein
MNPRGKKIRRIGFVLLFLFVLASLSSVILFAEFDYNPEWLRISLGLAEAITLWVGLPCLVAGFAMTITLHRPHKP